MKIKCSPFFWDILAILILGACNDMDISGDSNFIGLIVVLCVLRIGWAILRNAAEGGAFD